MSRTLDLFTPSRTRAGTTFGLLNPRNIQRAFNVGQQAASIARTAYNGLSDALRSPRIAAGSVRNFSQSHFTRPSNMARNSFTRTRYRGRRSRGRMPYRRRRRSRRAKPAQQFQRIIKRKSRGIRNLMRLCKSDNPNYVYDYASVGTLSASFDATKHTRMTCTINDMDRLKYFMTNADFTGESAAWSREFKPLKVWVKAIPKRAHLFASGDNTTIAEVKDDQLRFLTLWPKKHNLPASASLAGVPKVNIMTNAGIKFIKFEKRSATIMQHAPLIELSQTLSAGSSDAVVHVPLKSFPYMEYPAEAIRTKIQLCTFDAQLPQFYTSVTPTTEDKRELPKYEFEIHAIFKLRTRANNLLEVS